MLYGKPSRGEDPDLLSRKQAECDPRWHRRKKRRPSNRVECDSRIGKAKQGDDKISDPGLQRMLEKMKR